MAFFRTEKPGIIVFGAPRSGTTLLRRLLGAHPEISCPGETFLMRGAARMIGHDTISGGFDYGVLGALEGLGIDRAETLERLRLFVSGFYEDLARREGKKRWAAKTAVDSFYIPQIEQIFGAHCRYVCILRHGLDAVCSMEEFTKSLQTYVAELHAYIVRHPRPLEAFARAWSDATSSLLDFAARNAERCHVLKYEDLVRDPEGEMRRVTDFLEEKPLAKTAAEILGGGDKTVGGIGDWTSYRKSAVDASGIGRWKNLPEAEIPALAALVNPVLQRAGYDPVPPGDPADSARRRELAALLMHGGNG